MVALLLVGVAGLVARRRILRTPNGVVTRARLAGLAAVQVAPLVEQVGAEAGLADRLEELLGDDRVGVDVGAVERRDEPPVDVRARRQQPAA